MTDHAGLIVACRELAADRRYDISPAVRGSLATAASAITSLVKERDEARNLAERMKLEAQAHAQEARTANSTIYEIYQAISGASGEPGNWHGAEPVRTYVEAAEARCARLEEALRPFADAAEELPEHIHDLVPVVLTTDEEDNPKTIVHIEDFRRARQALEEQG